LLQMSKIKHLRWDGGSMYPINAGEIRVGIGESVLILEYNNIIVY